MQGLRSPVGLASPPAYTMPPVSRANPAGDVGLQGFRSPVGLAPPPAYTVPPVSRANPAGDVGLQGLRSPVGLAPPPARRCAAPVRELAPRGCVAYAGVSLARWARSTTLCRPFHGLIPRVMLVCRGCAPPEGVAPPPAYTVPPVSRAKIVFMPVVARRRGYIEIFFRVIYC